MAHIAYLLYKLFIITHKIQLNKYGLIIKVLFEKSFILQQIKKKSQLNQNAN